MKQVFIQLSFVASKPAEVRRITSFYERLKLPKDSLVIIPNAEVKKK